VYSGFSFPLCFSLTTFALVKRILTPILALLYLAITSGVLINVHYCMGEVAAVDYGHDSSSTCENCGMKSKAGCCSTETAFIKVSEQQKADATPSMDAPLPQIVASVYDHSMAVETMQFINASRQGHSPPGLVKPSLNILYGNFRI